MSAPTQPSTTAFSKQEIALPRTLGYILVVIGAVGAIGAAVYVTHSGDPIWAAILAMFLLERVRDTKVEYRWKPTVLGGTMAVLSILLGAACVYLKSPTPLWGLILIGFLTDAIV